MPGKSEALAPICQPRLWEENGKEVFLYANNPDPVAETHHEAAPDDLTRVSVANRRTEEASGSHY
ncbi:MAG: hypothetical protein NZ740_10330 [Kiritimatiellae bacterium]|nr:hypothetical protein [Kiritimatiellia bacterium]MDW8459485.1 hypothetical protein [Verrucomicrobiota bacterium]